MFMVFVNPRASATRHTSACAYMPCDAISRLHAARCQAWLFMAIACIVATDAQAVHTCLDATTGRDDQRDQSTDERLQGLIAHAFFLFLRSMGSLF
jgi:5-carboxymethyl-2-hydroxymuconate isomerase